MINSYYSHSHATNITTANCYDTHQHSYRVFIDADKKHYLEYLAMMMGDSYEGDWTPTKRPVRRSRSNGSRCLLKDGSVIIVDNTLWKGLVLEKVMIIYLCS